MKRSTSAVTASSASRSAGSRCRLRIRLCRDCGYCGQPEGDWPSSRPEERKFRGLLDAYGGLPEPLDAGLVVGRPLAVVVDELDGCERRRARRGRDVGPHRAAVAEPGVEVAGLLGEDPVDERLSSKKVFCPLHDADGAHLEARVRWDGEVDPGRVLGLLRQDVVAPV